MHHSQFQGSRDQRQRNPAPPPHVLGSSRDRYIANIFTACGFSHNDSQHFRNFTVESQEQWIALLESYKDKEFRVFTPGYEELPEILERLRAAMSSHQSGSRKSQSQTITSTLRPTQSQPRSSDKSHRTTQPPEDVTPLPQTRQPLQYPDSTKHLPRLTPLTLRQRVREAGLEGVLCDFVPLASLANRDPCKELKERLEKAGMANYVEFVPLASLANENPSKRFREQLQKLGMADSVEFVSLASLANEVPGKSYKEHLEKFGLAGSVEWGLPGPL